MPAEPAGATSSAVCPQPEEPEILTLTKTAVVARWCSQFCEGIEQDGKLHRSAFNLQKLKLEANLQILNLAQSKDVRTHQWFTHEAGKKNPVCYAKKVATNLNLVLGGTVTLEQPKVGYLLGLYGGYKLWVDATDLQDSYPYTGWCIPCSADETETTLTLEDHPFEVVLGAGRAKVSVPLVLKVLKLKEECHDAGAPDNVVLVRPHLDFENVKINKAKPKGGKDKLLESFEHLRAPAPKRALPEPTAALSAKDKKRKLTSVLEAFQGLGFLFTDAICKDTGLVLVDF